MSTLSTNGLKRPHGDDDGSNAAKRSRSNNGSPAPAAAPARPDVAKMVAEAQERARAVAARLQKAKGVGNNTSSTTTSTSAGASVSGMSKMEQLKARVAAAVKGPSTAAAPISTAPAPSYHPPTSTASAPSYHPPEPDYGPSRARGGLDIGLHPALLPDANHEGRSSKYKQAMQPLFATTMANRRRETTSGSGTTKSKPQKAQLDISGPSVEEVRNNPYFDSSLGAQTATPKGRPSRQFIFNQKGKYIQQAAALRRQAALEQMKKRIAESSRRAGIDEDLDTEKAFLVPAPPEIEWWDEGLVNGSSYSALDDASNLKIDTPDSIITVYVQHPILIEPPQDKNMPAPKPMYLTSKEQAKLRRQRRMADLKEQQAKVRLGLEPAPAPKVKRGNLMRVLGEEAVRDPTAVEARVNREIAERASKHEQINEERKLSKEQRHEKINVNQEKDAQKGIHACVFKIDNLANGRHRYKININATQNALTGQCISHPRFCLVIIEGGEHSVANYKKLMLNRIDWTENSPSIDRSDDKTTAAGGGDKRNNNDKSKKDKEAMATWLKAEDEKGNLKDLSLNKCILIWEGEVKQRGYKRWGRSVCETDAEAKEILTRGKYENFWTLAKSWK
ncbi:MAG: hypothetical protein M1823_002165 [Watsoniomyces obsoletus]|nr:MAG: hypothetical protein M1823_002165 [Watsoniomyces obsoletus]